MTMQILVALKWSALRTEVDPASGASQVLPGQFGSDPASLAALMWALRLAESVEATVTVATVGTEAAEEGLRVALALGADHACRVDAPEGCTPTDVAAALVPLATEADLVVVGARSIDGGSAAVAPALAASLDRPQACGLLEVEWHGDHLLAERRLPAGRRERVRLALPAVISMEAGSIPPGRAPLPALLAAADADIRRISPDRTIMAEPPGTTGPYRPRPRTVPAPPAGEEPRDRIATLTGALDGGSRAQQIESAPEEAAEEIVAVLRRWGYLED
jgi:electron transfer flavoprotein beta subunit